MERFVVVVLNIGEAFIPFAWMLRVVHAHNVYDLPIDDICLAISLGWKVMDLVSLVSNVN